MYLYAAFEISKVLYRKLFDGASLKGAKLEGKFTSLWSYNI